MLLTLLERLQRRRSPGPGPKYSLPTVTPIRYEYKKPLPKCYDIKNGILIITPIDKLLWNLYTRCSESKKE
jgi:hypothetical protein